MGKEAHIKSKHPPFFVGPDNSLQIQDYVQQELELESEFDLNEFV